MKSPMGRRRWTTRLTTEDCFALEIGELVRAGVFEVAPGTRCSTTWNDNAGMPISSITFRVSPDKAGTLAIHFDHQVAATISGPARIQRQIVPLTTSTCNFGGVRRWFRCSLIRDGYPCKRRVRVLYSTPCEKLFGCRQCHNLTFRSAQEHDKRIDWLLKQPAEEFIRALSTGTLQQRLLASRASTKLFERLARKADRLGKKRPKLHTQAVRARTHVIAIQSRADAI